jgi:hypothetical protein
MSAALRAARRSQPVRPPASCPSTSARPATRPTPAMSTLQSAATGSTASISDEPWPRPKPQSALGVATGTETRADRKSSGRARRAPGLRSDRSAPAEAIASPRDCPAWCAGMSGLPLVGPAGETPPALDHGRNEIQPPDLELRSVFTNERVSMNVHPSSGSSHPAAVVILCPSTGRERRFHPRTRIARIPLRASLLIARERAPRCRARALSLDPLTAMANGSEDQAVDVLVTRDLAVDAAAVATSLG